MSQQRNLLHGIALDFGEYICNLLRPVDNPVSLINLLNTLGWNLDYDEVLVAELDSIDYSVINKVIELYDLIDSYSDIDDDIKQLSKILEVSYSLIQSIPPFCNQIEELLINSTVNFLLHDFSAAEMSNRLWHYIVLGYLRCHHSDLYQLLVIASLVSEDSHNPKIRVNQLTDFCKNPFSLIKQRYSWDTAFDHCKFLNDLKVYLNTKHVSCAVYPQFNETSIALGYKDSTVELRVPLVRMGEWPATYVELGMNLTPTVDGGIALLPFLGGAAEFKECIGDNFEFSLNSNLDIDSYAIVLSPKGSLGFKPIRNGTTSSTVDVDGTLEMGVHHKREAGRILLFGQDQGNRLEVGKMGLNLFLEANTKTDRQELTAELEVCDLMIAISMSKCDALINKLLSDVDIEAILDIGFGYSIIKGFHIRGSGSLSINIPLDSHLGPVLIKSLHLALMLTDNLDFIAKTSFNASLGPVLVSIDQIGISIPVYLGKNSDKNSCPIRIGPMRFIPPTGAGLLVDIEGIVGGGSLSFEKQYARYSGTLALGFGEVALTAIGVITTRMPDGSDGFSMLISICTSFNPGIQLGLGLTLVRAGGLIGINRRLQIDTLQRGIREGSLNSVLFPDEKEIVSNANKIISDIRTVFPAQEGRFVVGPMLKVGYGTPTVISGEIGLFFEFPVDHLKVVLLGKIEAKFPSQEAPLVVIRANILGVLDTEKDEMTFQGSLFDSRILQYTLLGDSAFLLRWGDDPEFILTMGGFHPRFDPPSPDIIFANLNRMTLCISCSDKFRMESTSYFAITTNTIQFGADSKLKVKACGAELEGGVGYDTLIVISPFSFEADISGFVRVKFKGHKLTEIGFYAMLSGPTPWNVRGEAYFEILFWDVDVDFNFTWGQREKKRIEAEDPAAKYREILDKQAVWTASLSPGRRPGYSLRSLEKGFSEPGKISVNPNGVFSLRQNLLPLDITMAKLGYAPIKGHDRIEITEIRVGDKVLETEPVYDKMARGMFEDLPADMKLSAPSFEKMQVGVQSIASSQQKIEGTSELDGKTVEYESLLLNYQEPTVFCPVRGKLTWSSRQSSLAHGLRCGAGVFGNGSRSAVARINDYRYSVVRTDTLSSSSINNQSFNSYTAAVQSASNRNSGVVPGEYSVVPVYEASDGEEV